MNNLQVRQDLINIIIIDMDNDQSLPKRQSTFPLFSKYFNTHPQDVVDYANAMRKQFEDFIEAFKKRIEVEVTYSKNLTQVSKFLDKYIKPQSSLSTSFICSAFKVENQQRSRQAIELAQALKTQIEAMCQQMLKNQTAFFKKFQKDVKKFSREAQTVESNHNESLNRFESISREMQEMIITKNIMKYTTGIPQQKKVKLISKTMEGIKEHKEYQKLYMQSVKDYNHFTNVYSNQITNQLKEAQKMLREQVVMQADCIRKLIVAEVSLFKNIEYDVLNISKQMEETDTQKDVQIFVDQHKNDISHRIMLQQKEKLQAEAKRSGTNTINGDAPDFYNIVPKKIMGKSMLSSSLLHVDEEYFSWMLFNKKNKRLRDIISIIWKKHKSSSNGHSNKQKQKVQLKSQNGHVLPVIEEKNQEHAQKKQQTNADVVNEGQQKVKEELPPQNDTQVTKVQKVQKAEQAPQTNPEVINMDWQKEIKDWLYSLRIPQPPSFMPSTQKKENKPIQTLFNSIVQITKVVSQLWNIDYASEEEASQKLFTLQRYMSQHHLYRLIALIFIEEYRLQLEVMIKNINCAKVSAKILKTIIKESQKQNDTFIIRGILGLIFTFYWTDQKYKKLLYVSPQVYQCDIWKKHDFWEAAIFETTYEEMAVFTKQKGQTSAETMLREKNLIFSQLASFCHYMVMLGISSKNVRLIVGRYCRLYDMSEQQNKDLSKMITNTAKQFKETASQFNLKGAEKQKSVLND